MASERPTLSEAARLSGRVLLVVAVLAVAGWVIAQLSLLFVAVFVAVLLAGLLAPLVEWLARSGWPRTLAALVPVVVAVAVLGAVLSWILPVTVSEIRSHGEELVRRLDQLVRTITRRLPGATADLETLVSEASTLISANTSRIAQGIAAALAQAGRVLAGVLLAIVLAFFFVRDGAGVMRRWFASLSPPRREVVQPACMRAWQTLGGWIRGAVIVATVDALGIGVGLVIVGVPLAVPLAVLTFLGAFIPVVGATVAGAAAVVVAWATGGTTDALIVLAIVIGVQQLEGNVLQPLVMGHYVPLHPAVILIAVTAGALIAGIAGAFVAVPLTATVTAGLLEFRARTQRRPTSHYRAHEEEHPHAPH